MCPYPVTVGHVDTWTAWIEEASKPVIDAVDWLGNDAYPYFQGDNLVNGFANASYWAGMRVVEVVSQGKPVWATETGWPFEGPVSLNAKPSIPNQQTYWTEVVSDMPIHVGYSTDRTRPVAVAIPSPSSGIVWYDHISHSENVVFINCLCRMTSRPVRRLPSLTRTPTR